ncbi:hypothetical protein SASPL_134886 [Salvia splendens]|uniref:DYW domain-containing protein n=1 Tax=Salvia splendens TaxID=180675 RepID=A0A8X8WYM6_SALSN|nr:hypothetical protein SASPL_134886 [Salvia splendens]
MFEEGIVPNSYTLAAMLSVSSNLASLNHGGQIHAVAKKLGEMSSVSVGNALISMYARAGNITSARKAFRLIQQRRDPVSWTSMITGLAQHGHGEEALELFEDMLLLEIKPDHITYVGVLSACTHMGLIEKGRSYFTKMIDIHGIMPTSSHCACMIDLYGRAGLLNEAQDFILNMTIEPDIIAWGSLLASCKAHKNLEVAAMAAERMISIDPDNSGAYSALANVYSACGKWEEAAIIRKSMKDRKVKKEQGISWLQIKGEVHIFGADDALHPQRDAIDIRLTKIWEEIKKMGFVPDTASVLHDLDDELKEQLLKHHSEKLAIVFGVMNMPEKSTLTIMKNLRVCNDCHSAIKYISKLVGREIVVRDATRFHHFRDGACSFLQSRQHVRLNSARALPCHTIELNFFKNKGLNYSPTSIMLMNVPSISKLQWHPFTISSRSSLESDNVTIIKGEGKWTTKLIDLVDHLDVSIEGIYGHASTDLLRIELYKLIQLVEISYETAMASKCMNILSLIITIVVLILLTLSTRTTRRRSNPGFVLVKPKSYLQRYNYLEFGAWEEPILEFTIRTYQENFWDQAQRKMRC